MQEIPTMQQPPPVPQLPTYPQQPPTYPPYPYREFAAVEGQYYDQPYYGSPVPPPKKRWSGKRILLWVVMIIAILFVGSAVIAGIVAGIRAGTSSTPAPVQTQPPVMVTPTPQPTLSAEDTYKQSATTIPIAELVASGDQYNGKVIHIAGTVIISAVTDNGASGMFVQDPNVSGKLVAVMFPKGTKMDGFLPGDKIHVWGLGLGTTVLEGRTYAVMTAVYYTDTTAGISK